MTPREGRPRTGLTPALGAAIGCAVIWGVNVPVMKAGLQEVDPFFFNAARLTLSAAALGLLDAAERRGQAKVPTPWRKVVTLGLLSSLVYQVLFLLGMDATSAGNTAIIVASGPLWTAIIESLMGVDRHPGQAWGALGVAFVGTMLVTLTGIDDPTGGATLLGNLVMLAAMGTWAFATVLSRPLLETFPATRLAFLAVLVSLPGHWALALPGLDLSSVGRPGFVASTIAYSGILSTGVAYALWNRSVKDLGAARTAAFSNLVPVVALAVAWVYLGEQPRLLQLAGGALVVAGLLMWRTARRST
ncbi:DMT family transporter [bacterium]|nr:DMT family transporter [bacterium]